MTIACSAFGKTTWIWLGRGTSASAFVVRMVLGVHEDDTDDDVYLFAEKFRFRRLQAELKLTRTGADALEFELVGDDSIGKHAGLGQADLWLSGFEVVTGSTIISWASSLAANRAALAKGQHLCSYVEMLWLDFVLSRTCFTIRCKLGSVATVDSLR